MFTPPCCPLHSVWLSLLHIYFFIHPLYIPTPSIRPIFHFFLWSTVPNTISFLFFNLDFHRSLFHLSHSDSLSLYFFWWQSLIFTSLCLTLPLSACTAVASLWVAPLWLSSISIPPGWLDFTMCRVSPHQKANNEKRNVWRNPALSLHVREEVEKARRGRGW